MASLFARHAKPFINSLDARIAGIDFGIRPITPKTLNMQSDHPTASTKSWKPALAVVIVAALAGAAIWALSPVLTSRTEPWDGSWTYYLVALLSSSAGASLISPRQWLLSGLGLFLGQLGFMLVMLEAGPLIIIGVVALAVYTSVGMLGGLVVWVGSTLIGRNHNRRLETVTPPIQGS